MISYIKGKLTEVEIGKIVVETGGIGFEISVPQTVTGFLPVIGEEVKIFTYFRVSEDAMNLYGFLSRADMEMFESLIGVSGIGPKGALAVMSALSPDALRLAILSGDDKAIAKAPGIGAKTAQRIIIDLKDKIGSIDGISMSKTAAESSKAGMAVQETMEALVSLGYSASDAARAVRGIETDENTDAETLLKMALRRI